MRILGLTTLSLAGLLLGGRLTMVAFAPVLPAGFGSWHDESYDHAYIWAALSAMQQFDYLDRNGRWARTTDELLPGWDPAGRLAHSLSFEPDASGAFILTYRQDGSAFACTASATKEQARAFRRRPNWRSLRGPALHAEIAKWELWECRRVNWPWTWLRSTGLDRLREAPPERYSALDFVDRANGSDP